MDQYTRGHADYDAEIGLLFSINTVTSFFCRFELGGDDCSVVRQDSKMSRMG